MNAGSSPVKSDPRTVPLAQFIGYFLWLGTVGFGGPIALAGRMLQDLVETRGWIRREDYLEGLALAQLAPGPLAAQLSIYLGYVRAGVLGATAVGIAFVLPSFLMVLGIAATYVRYGGLPWMQAVFYGVGAAAIGIIARSAIKLIKATLKNDALLWAIFLVLAVSTAITKREIIWLFLGSGILSLAVKQPLRKLAGNASFLPLLVATPFTNNKIVSVFVFFAKAGLFVFGSGLVGSRVLTKFVQ
jgi:chromate transporter